MLEITKAKVAEYVASFNESNHYRGDPQLLDQVKQLYCLLNAQDKREFYGFIDDKSNQAMPMSFLAKKAYLLMLGTAIGCVSLPIIDACAGGSSSFSRILATGMAGGVCGAFLASNLGASNETHERLRALRPYSKIGAATKLLSPDALFAPFQTVHEILDRRMHTTSTRRS